MAKLAILEGPRWYDALNNQDWFKREKERVSNLYVDIGYTPKDLQNIEISAQPIYASHEFTIIDDSDLNFVVVEDDTGMVRTIPREKKNDSSGWIVAALIAGLLIL